VPPIAIDQATVLPGIKEWYVLANDGRAAEWCLHLADMANGNPEVGHYVPILGRKGRAMYVPPDRVIDLGAGPFVLLGGSTNYYHWMIDYLPRLQVLLPEEAPWAGLPYLVNADLAPFQIETLKRAGLDESRLVRLPAAPVAARCDRLFAAPIGAVAQIVRPTALEWLRRLYPLPVRWTGIAPAKRVYISRQDAGLRRVVNEDEITAHLKTLGFRILLPSGLSVARQAQALARAEIIVGPHGAGLTNMVFAPKGAFVIEMSAGSRRHLGFMEALARACGHRYARLPCATHPSADQKGRVNDEDQDMLVSKDALAALIERPARS
jgi:capsular polysaccharide biosynthesis protein